MYQKKKNSAYILLALMMNGMNFNGENHEHIRSYYYFIKMVPYMYQQINASEKYLELFGDH